VPKCTGPAMYIDFIPWDAHVPHKGHGDNGKGFVHLPKIHIVFVPSDPIQQLLGSRNRGGGEPARFLGMTGMTNDFHPDREAVFPSVGVRRQNKRCSTIRNRRRIGGGYCPLLAKGGFQMRNFFRTRIGGLFVACHYAVAFG